jgi:hypothetical protein
MDAQTVEVTLKSYLTGMRVRLDKAAAIARAAEACALSGNVETGVEITHDIEQLLYEVTTFLNAASMFRRLSHEED